MAAKVAVSLGEVAREKLDAIVGDFFGATAGIEAGPDRLFGGFSAANYRAVLRVPANSAKVACAEASSSARSAVTETTHMEVLLKCCNEQPAEEAAEQAAALDMLAQHGGIPAPRCFTRAAGTGYVSELLGEGRPTLCMTLLPGSNADTVARSNDGQLELTVIRGVGGGLGALHNVPCPPPGQLRHCMHSRGCCMVGQQREAQAAMVANEYTVAHPFTSFHAAALPALEATMNKPGLPAGILHGDPFLDNMLADPTTGKLTGIIDWEDVAVGPLLFDIACCVAGCCYAPDNSLDSDRIKALLEGYVEKRNLTITSNECQLFPEFVRVALLCNAAWRFQNFHIHHREAIQARDSYRELQDRIEALDAGADRATLAAALDNAMKK